MGVTPELCGLDVGGTRRMVAVDKSADMIRSTWPGRLGAADDAICADWRQMPLADSSADIVLGDGSLNALPDAASYLALSAELNRIVRPGGRCVIRCFVQPETPETLDEVFGDLEANRIGSFHVLKWRVAMALQPDVATGVPVGEVWQAVHDACPDPEQLAARFAWPIREVLTIEAYRNVKTRYTFPTLRECCAFLTASGLSCVRTVMGRYELGERCPTVIADRRGSEVSLP
jgi:SAM-dependent methyltransferase